MTEGLLHAGVSAEKIRVLPHSVDTKRFTPREGAPAYDIVSVGQLIQRKRMDVLIDALGLLKQQGVQLRAAILGRGPLEDTLRERALAQGVSEQVEFLGYRDDVEQVLAQAGTFCLASEWEGVPFAMMEAMAAGLVPVVTDVGTIADWVTPGENGCIVPVGDPAALAASLKHLHADNGALRNRFRTRLIAERERLSFAEGAQVWREIFKL
jgi:glycosyltransferase involved in cell wall biosynthesis